MTDELLIEELAALEHEQWKKWSMDLAASEGQISLQRLKRWENYWVDYCDLPEKVKNEDREWARKALNILKNHV